MRVTLVTGGNRDYIALEPETIREFSELLRVYVSPFIVSDFRYLDIGNINAPYLRIYVSPVRSNVPSSEILDQIDQT